MASVARIYWQAQGSSASSAEHKHMESEKEKRQNLANRSSHGILRAQSPEPWFLCFLNEDSDIYQIRFS